MLTQNIYKVFFQYVIPSILGLLSISSASIIDGYFIGNYVGSKALASVNISYPIFSILFGFALMFAVGNSVVFSKLLGERKIKEALNIFSKALILITIASLILVSILFINLDNILFYMNINGELRLLTKSYLNIILLFMPFLMIGIVFDYFVRADENPNLSFLALLFSAVVNIILDYIFIVRFEYGLKGAAYATGISQAIIIFILIFHFFNQTHKLRFIKPSGSFIVIFKSLRNGLSEFINETSAGITVLIFNIIIIKYLGDKGISAYTIVAYFIMLNIMISFAIGDGIQPIIAKHFGAKEFIRIKQFFRLAIISILGFSSIFIIFILLFPNFFINIFLNNKDINVEKITVEFLSYTWLAFLFIGINILITSYFTAIHKPYPSAIISILRSLVLPLFFIIVLSHYFGIVGVYITLVFSEAISFILAILLLKKYRLTST